MDTGIRSWQAWSHEGTLSPGGSWLESMRLAFTQTFADPVERLKAEQDGSRCLRIVGGLDKRIARAVKDQARSFVSQPGAWSIDLSGVDTWDAEGLASLVYALDVSEMNGCDFTLVAPCPGLRAMMQRAQLHHLFNIQTGDAEAA